MKVAELLFITINLPRFLKVSLIENKPLLAKVNSLECRSRRQHIRILGIKENNKSYRISCVAHSNIAEWTALLHV